MNNLTLTLNTYRTFYLTRGILDPDRHGPPEGYARATRKAHSQRTGGRTEVDAAKVGTPDTFERLHRHHQQREQKMQRKVADRNALEAKDCTFHPHFEHSPTSPAASARSTFKFFNTLRDSPRGSRKPIVSSALDPGSLPIEPHIAKKVQSKLKAACYGTTPREMFTRWDQDGSGCFDHEEFKKLVRSGLKINKADLPDSHIVQLTRALDKDGDGTLSIEELEHFVKDGVAIFATPEMRKKAAKPKVRGRSRAKRSAKATGGGAEVMGEDGEPEVEVDVDPRKPPLPLPDLGFKTDAETNVKALGSEVDPAGGIPVAAKDDEKENLGNSSRLKQENIAAAKREHEDELRREAEEAAQAAQAERERQQRERERERERVEQRALDPVGDEAGVSLVPTPLKGEPAPSMKRKRVRPRAAKGGRQRMGRPVTYQETAASMARHVIRKVRPPLVATSISASASAASTFRRSRNFRRRRSDSFNAPPTLTPLLPRPYLSPSPTPLASGQAARVCPRVRREPEA